MMKTEDIFVQYEPELKELESGLLSIFDCSSELVPLIGKHIMDGGGKRMRPLFLLMAADMCGYKGSDRIFYGSIIEAIHTASLLHDDVIDEAETRRGKESAHRIWGNRVVVLAGDYLYSNCIRIAAAKNNRKIIETLSEATTRMSEGEILQLHKTGDPTITLDEYYTIISAKTGVLISAACRIGAILAGQPDDREAALAEFGLKTGIAFQLADDILDYVAMQDDLGKKLGKDLEEGKITMPMIHLLSAAPGPERLEVIRIIEETVTIGKRKVISGRGKEANLRKIISLFSKYNAIEESFDIARGLVKEAAASLCSFPDSDGKKAILAMADYTLQRNK
jgi:octaprenyl-diphosphate synthase